MFIFSFSFHSKGLLTTFVVILEQKSPEVLQGSFVRIFYGNGKDNYILIIFQSYVLHLNTDLLPYELKLLFYKSYDFPNLFGNGQHLSYKLKSFHTCHPSLYI